MNISYQFSCAEVAQEVEQRTENPLTWRTDMTTREWVTISQVEKVLSKHSVAPINIVMEELKSLPHKRIKAPPAPAGAIGVRQAAIKYGISPATVTRLVQKGKVKIILRTANWLYIDDNDLKDLLVK